METLEIELYGNVQGVGCRAYVRHVAQKFGVKGWVKNDGEDEGKVIVHAQGSEGKLGEFLRMLRTGWHPIIVKGMKTRKIDEQEHLGFTVKY
ncbi:Acylphosphatase [Candidatus Anstonella stagnisolia]|nr:Acylphosphatase [Candidatus Anstonella stagnisolia]